MARRSGELIGKAPRGTRLCNAGIWSAAVGVVLVLASSAYRFGLIASPFPALFLYAFGSLALIVAFIATLIGLIRSGGSAGRASASLTWLALVAGLLLTGNNVMQLRKAAGAPPIHDITTDTADPPKFVAVLPLRATAANPPDYPGAEFAEQQKKAFPDLQTVTVEAPAEDVFRRAEAAARALGWEIVAAVPSDGRIEATDTTKWFGFKDDVVIRITPAGTATRVDVRSKSRVGRGDAGVNARRIRAFRDRLLAAGPLWQ
jgi:uncharacterized protein (DUF1499 family)